MVKIQKMVIGFIVGIISLNSIIIAQSVNRTLSPIKNYGSGVEKVMKKGVWKSDTTYYSNQYVDDIGNWKTSDTTKMVARSVLYFNLRDIPNYSVIKSVKLSYWGSESDQKSTIVTLDKYDVTGYYVKDWFLKIRTGTKNVNNEIKNGSNTSTISNKVGEVFFNQVLFS